jgi:hypothetical protein
MFDLFTTKVEQDGQGGFVVPIKDDLFSVSNKRMCAFVITFDLYKCAIVRISIVIQ